MKKCFIGLIILLVIASTPFIVKNVKENLRINSVNDLLEEVKQYMNDASDDIDLTGNLFDVINLRLGNKFNEGEIRIDGNDIGIAVKIDGICYIKDFTSDEIKKTDSENCVVYEKLSEDSSKDETEEISVTCYGETKIIDTIKLNYDGCMANLNKVLETDYNTKELDSFCKNEQYVGYYYYLENYITGISMQGDDISKYIDNNIVVVTYETVCKTCFEYSKIPSQYEINYDRCMNSLYKKYYDSENLKKFCSGETTNNGNSINEMAEFDIVELYMHGAIDVKEKNNLMLIDYLCYEKNTENLPTITDLVIPSKINGLKITNIGYELWEESEKNGVFENKGLMSVIIPDGIKAIGSDAFANNKITSIELPSSLKTIEYGAFSKNKITGELDLSNLTNLTTIGEGAFLSNQITSVKIPNSVTSIENYAFSNNSSLTLVEIDNIKDAISGSPWGAYDATIKWLRDS